jgi:hypothetical protein
MVSCGCQWVIEGIGLADELARRVMKAIQICISIFLTSAPAQTLEPVNKNAGSKRFNLIAGRFYLP